MPIKKLVKKPTIPPGGFAGHGSQTPATQQLFNQAVRPTRKKRRKVAKKKRVVRKKRPTRKKRATRKKKPARLVKGSAAAKRHMAKLRRMRKKK